MGSVDLPVKKIYIDSAFRRLDSVSASNFKIELPYTVKFNDNTIFYVDDVCIPHTWHTVAALFCSDTFGTFLAFAGLFALCGFIASPWGGLPDLA